MKAIRIVLGGLFVLALVGCGGSPTSKKEDKPIPAAASNAELIVGVWEFVTASDEGEAAKMKGMTAEFTKDGKLKMKIKTPDGKEIEAPEATYSIEGDTMTQTMKMGDKETKDKMKIVSLDKTTLKTEEEKEGKKITHEFKKK
jgi:uncharacterized protein (TIGR03066 family)